MSTTILAASKSSAEVERAETVNARVELKLCLSLEIAPTDYTFDGCHCKYRTRPSMIE